MANLKGCMHVAMPDCAIVYIHLVNEMNYTITHAWYLRCFTLFTVFVFLRIRTIAFFIKTKVKNIQE